MARRLRTVRPTPRRKRVWADQQWTDAGFAEDSLRSENLLSDYITNGGATQGVTVVRTVIQLMWLINEAHTPADHMTFGLIKGTKTQADIADVVAEPYSDWAWAERQYPGMVTGLVTADAPECWIRDIRSQRKIEEVGETWWLTYQLTAPTTATATCDVKARARTLLLLP